VKSFVDEVSVTTLLSNYMQKRRDTITSQIKKLLITDRKFSQAER